MRLCLTKGECTVPEEKKIKVYFFVEGDLARALMDEMAEMAKRGDTPSKSAIGRTALVEYFKGKGKHVEDATGTWGGKRDAEDEEGQWLAVAAG